MPKKRKTYKRVIFTPEVIKNAINAVEIILDKENVPGRYEISTSSEGWEYNNEDEFFADYIKDFKSASILKMYNSGSKGIFNI